VGRKVDLDDLVSAVEVANTLGLANRNAVYVYRGRYSDFPEPVLQHGRCLLWLRSEIVTWQRRREAASLPLA
jgi:predicted DNA-binding transcriptional regulator AlpA